MLSEFKMQVVREASSSREPRHAWSWCEVGAIAGLTAGLIAVLFGSLLTALSWMAHAANTGYLRFLGTTLLVLTIPLLVCGAHCLDLMERRKHLEREKRFREQP